MSPPSNRVNQSHRGQSSCRQADSRRDRSRAGTKSVVRRRRQSPGGERRAGRPAAKASESSTLLPRTEPIYLMRHRRHICISSGDLKTAGPARTASKAKLSAR